MGDFNPSNGMMRNALEATEGILVNSGFHYHDFVSESLTSLQEVIEQRSITRSAQQPLSAESKIALGGQFDTDLNAEGHVHYLANAQKKFDTSTLTTGVYQHKLAPSAGTAFPTSMQVEVFRDDDMPQVFHGSRVNQVSLGLGLRQFLQCQFGIISPMADYWRYPTQEAGSGGPFPLLRGLANYANRTAADPDIYMKCISAASKTFAVKIGNAATYGATLNTITNATTWYDLVDSNGTGRIGDKGIKVEGYFPNFTSLADNDEWKWSAARAEWVPVYPDVVPFNEVYAEIIVDGEEFRTNQLTLNLTRPVTGIYSIGGRFPKLVRERGRRQVAGTLVREYLTNDLRIKLENAKTFALRVVAETNIPIGSTAYYHAIEAIAPLCRLGGPTPTIGSETQMDENLTFTCHPDPTDGDGNVDDLQLYVTNSIANITA